MRLWRKLVNQDCLEILDTRWYKIKHEYGGELLLLLFFFVMSDGPVVEKNKDKLLEKARTACKELARSNLSGNIFI